MCLCNLSQKIKNLKRETFLVGYEKGPFSEEKVDRFLGEMKKKYQTVIDDTKRQRVSK